MIFIIPERFLRGVNMQEQKKSLHDDIASLAAIELHCYSLFSLFGCTQPDM